LCLPPACR